MTASMERLSRRTLKICLWCTSTRGNLFVTRHGKGVFVSVAPDGRRMLRVEARNAQTPIERKPEWIRTTAKMGPEYTRLNTMVKASGLHTVCQEAACPNIFECWEDKEATFLIGGEQCTRRCDFCQIDTGKPDDLDRDEPRRVAESVRQMGLRYATITGVARDDLSDGGAWLYAETIRQVHQVNPGTGVEILVPDFDGVPELVAQVLEAKPEVFAHNVETVPRLFKSIRPAFQYERSLAVISLGRDAGLVTKSNLILGMGEEEHEIDRALRDLRAAGTDLITITQYLRPSPRHHPIDRWVKPEEFVRWSDLAEQIGYKGVMSGPLVRSSYRAGRLWAQAMKRSGRPVPENLAHLVADSYSPARQEAASLVKRRLSNISRR
jgi:lipoic acid synthetase